MSVCEKDIGGTYIFHGTVYDKWNERKFLYK